MDNNYQKRLQNGKCPECNGDLDATYQYGLLVCERECGFDITTSELNEVGYDCEA